MNDSDGTHREGRGGKERGVQRMRQTCNIYRNVVSSKVQQFLCVLTLNEAPLVGMRSYLGEGALLGQRALVGLSEQLLEGVSHRVVAPLLRRQLLQPRKAAHRARSAVTRRSSRQFCIKKN